MDSISAFSIQHQLLAVFALTLVRQLGAPIPAWPALMLAGATSAMDPTFAVRVLGAAVAGTMVADFVWFFAGRRFGRRILGLVCRISVSPDICVAKSEKRFAERGAATLVVAKFVPGLDTVAPALAGALGIGTRPFALYTAIASVLWAGTGIAVGAVFQRQVEAALDWMASFGRLTGWLLLALVLGYIGRHAWLRWSAGRSASMADTSG